MIRHYFKIAWRSFWKGKTFSLINISGLSIGMAATILILLWIQNEFQFDSSYKKSDRIYQLFHREQKNGKISVWGNSPDPMAMVLKASYPEIEDAIRVTEHKSLLSAGDRHLKSSGVFADAGFISMFDFDVLNGNTKDILNNINSIVITEALAKRMFGNENAIGKVIRIDTADNFFVTAVLKDLPGNTRFHFEYVLPWLYLEKSDGKNESWTAYNNKTYVLLKPGVNLNLVNEKIKLVAIHHANIQDKTRQLTQFLYPAKKWHLYDKSENGQMVSGQMERIKLFALIAGLILLIACINFMNLGTARSEKRAKEVGVRKVAGANRQSLIFQFMLESIFLAFIAGVVAVLLVQLSLPAYNHLLQASLQLQLTTVSFWSSWMGFVLFTGILAGSYPAFVLSAYQVAKVLKGTFKSTGKAVTPRKALVVVQFTFAVILIVSTIIITRQIRYAQDRDTGFDAGQLVFSPLEAKNKHNYALLKEDLLNSGAVTAVTRSLVPISAEWTSNMWGYEWPSSAKEDAHIIFDVFSADADFAKTTGAKIISGRDIDIYNYPTDSSAILLNEKAVDVMQIKTPIGLTVRRGNERYHVVGVVKNFIIGSPYNNIQPMVVMGPENGRFRTVHYKLNPAFPVQQSLAKIETIFKKYNPDYPFEFQFVNEAYAYKFKSEQTTKTLAALFAGLAIFISCLGLFGLVAYMVEIRTKEIGVRKVLGASVLTIVQLLSKEYLCLVVIAVVIASPIAWLFMNKWVKDYAYRINISWWLFAAGGLVAIIIALVTISFQAIKAAVANPVKSLRTE